MAGETKEKESKPKSIVEIIQSLNDITTKFNCGSGELTDLHFILENLKNLTEEEIKKSNRKTELFAAIIGAIKSAINRYDHYGRPYVRDIFNELSTDLYANKGISGAEGITDFVDKFGDAVQMNTYRPKPLTVVLSKLSPGEGALLTFLCTTVGIMICIAIPPVGLGLPGWGIILFYLIMPIVYGVSLQNGIWLAAIVIDPIRDYLIDRRVNNAFEEVKAFKEPIVGTTQKLAGALEKEKSEEKEASTSVTKDVEAQQGVSAESGLGVVFKEIRENETSPTVSSDTLKTEPKTETDATP